MMEGWRNPGRPREQPAAALARAWRVALYLGIFVGVGAALNIAPMEGIQVVWASPPGELYGTGGDGLALGLITFLATGLYSFLASRSLGQDFPLTRGDAFLGGFLLGSGSQLVMGGTIFAAVVAIVSYHVNPAYLRLLMETVLVLGLLTGLVGGWLARRERARHVRSLGTPQAGRFRGREAALERYRRDDRGPVALLKHLGLGFVGFAGAVAVAVLILWVMAQAFARVLPAVPASWRNPLMFGTLGILTLALVALLGWFLYRGNERAGPRF